MAKDKRVGTYTGMLSVRAKSTIARAGTPLARSSATRCETTSVLPEPAEAMICKWVPRCCTAAKASPSSSRALIHTIVGVNLHLILGETVSLDGVHFLAVNPDISTMGLELNHLLPGETRNDLEDFAVVVDDPQHGVVQFYGDDLVGMDDARLNALAGDRDGAPTRHPAPDPNRVGSRGRRRARHSRPEPDPIPWRLS